MILWLLACSVAPYQDYWPDRSAYPIIAGLDPATVDGRAGGQTVTIEGRQLSNATTVIVGGRNAEIVSIDDRALLIRLPALPAGPEDVAVSVVTGRGATTSERALTVTTPVSDFVADETVSVSLLRLDCPIEAWGVYEDGEEYPFGWCGAELGYAAAEAWMGYGPQPGFAAETQAILPLSELPPIGQVRVVGPGDRSPPPVPLVFSAHGARERVSVTTPRNFENDYAMLLDRRALIEETYSWSESITEWRGPLATLMDDEQCWIDQLSVSEVSETELIVDGDATGATNMTLGFAFDEDYGDWVYTEEAQVSHAKIQADGSVVTSDVGGVQLGYDEVSGWFLPAGFVGPGDIGPGEYTVSTTDERGVESHAGYVLGGEPMDLWDTWPDLTIGYTPIDLEADLEVSWVPAPASKTPSIVAVEIAVYDMDISDPNGTTLITRLLAQAEDGDGKLVIPAEQLDRLPSAPNRWDDLDEASGYWGDMTIARHQLKRVRRAEGDIVIDFIHAINGPVFLERTEPEVP